MVPAFLCIPQDETWGHLPVTASFRNLEINQGSSFRHPRISKDQNPTAFLGTPRGTNILPHPFLFPSLTPPLPSPPKSKYPTAHGWAGSEWKMVEFLAGTPERTFRLGISKSNCLYLSLAPTLPELSSRLSSYPVETNTFWYIFFWLNLNVLFWSEWKCILRAPLH